MIYFKGCCKSRWIYEIEFPKDATPLQKLLLTYCAPFINEKVMNIWNRGDTHGMEGIENDTFFPKVQMGQNAIIWDKVTDRMDFKSVGMTEIPGLMASMATNTTRLENEELKWQSYDGNHAI